MLCIELPGSDASQLFYGVNGPYKIMPFSNRGRYRNVYIIIISHIGTHTFGKGQ